MVERIIIQSSDDVLRTFGNTLASLSEQDARRVMARAVNRTTRTIHGRVIRAVAKQSSIPLKILRKAVKMDLAAHKGAGPIQGAVYATGKELSLKHFGPKQFSFGTRAKVYGKTERYPSAFIYGGHWKTGNPAFHGHVMERDTKASFPVRRIKGPAIASEMVRDQALQEFERTVATMLPVRIRHELERMLTP